MCATTNSAERGAAVLPLVALLLVALALVAFAAARAQVAAHRIAAADADARAALAAAQAGLEHGLARAAALLEPGPEFDTGGAMVVAGPVATLPNGAGYRVTIHNDGLIPFDAALVEIESTGSGPGGGTRTVRQQARLRPWLAQPPGAALVVRGEAAFGAGLELVNADSALVRSGGGFSAPGALLAPGAAPPCPPSGICAGDPALAASSPESLFAATFARDAALLGGLAHARPCPDCAPGPMPDGAVVLWLEARPGEAYTLDAVQFGAPHAPVAVVVDGDLALAGNARIDGLLYINGDWRDAPGALEVRGAVIVAGNAHHTGAARITHDPDALARLRSRGPYARIAGSWNDFR